MTFPYAFPPDELFVALYPSLKPQTRGHHASTKLLFHVRYMRTRPGFQLLSTSLSRASAVHGILLFPIENSLILPTNSTQIQAKFRVDSPDWVVGE